MNSQADHFTAASAKLIPLAVENLSTDSTTSGSNSVPDESGSSPHVKPDAVEKSTDSINPGPPTSTQSVSAKRIVPANPCDVIQDDSIRTESIVSKSLQPPRTSKASSFEDSRFIATSGLIGMKRAASIAKQHGERLSKSPEELIDDAVERYRQQLLHGQPPLSDDLRTAIKAGVFRGRK